MCTSVNRSRSAWKRAVCSARVWLTSHHETESGHPVEKRLDIVGLI